MTQLKDVAKYAGVSNGTVSKVLNGSPGVSQKMKLRVLKAIQELDYQPNMVARSLRTKTTNLVAIMVPFTNDPYFVEFFRGVSMELRNIGCVPVLYSTEPNKSLSTQEIRDMVMRGIDGLIVSTFGWEEEVLAELCEIAKRVPVVSFKRAFPGTDIHSVVVDDQAGMYQAVSYLTSIGHRRIGFIAAGLDLETGRQRLEGYRQALLDAGIEVDENLIVACDSYQISEGYHSVQQLLKRHPLPTAIMGANDSISIGVLKYLESRNVRIPEDIAVMGYDDVPLSTIVTPRLSSVALPVYEMTARAVRIIEKAIKGEIEGVVNESFSGTLVIRKSTDFSATDEFEFERFSK